MDSSSRVPPHNNDAEISVLGSILTDDVFDLIADMLRPEMFYREGHRKIFSAMKLLKERSEPIDLVTVSAELARLGQLDEVGHNTYLVGLTQSVPTTAYVENYARIVSEKYTLRQLIRASNQAIRMAYDQQLPLEDLLNQAEKLIFEVASDKAFEQSEQDMKDLAFKTLDYIHTLHDHKGIPDGVSTGFSDLDKQISGFQKGSLNVLAARPAMGKTAFAMSVAQNIAIRSHKSVAVFSLEMSAMQLVMRMICSEARIEMSRIRSGFLSEGDFKRLIDASSRISESPLVIDDDPNLNINSLRTKLRRIIAKRGPLSLVVIDYLQLMSGTRGGSSENRQQEVSNISRGLKNLARELDVPVIVLSQLSRAVEQRPNKRPMLSDLRESGAIEQDADIVMFIYRDDYYNKDTDKQGVAEIIIGKQRNGPTGSIEMSFQSGHVRFENLAQREDVV